MPSFLSFTLLQNIDSTKTIIDLSIDYTKPSIYFESDWLIILVIAVLIGLIYLGISKFRQRNYPLTELEVEISGSPKATFKARRDDSTLYIANRIYIELITRKAALPIEESDVIIEIYNSWYKLFTILRDEIKSVPGHYLRGHDSTTALIGLTTKILNDGLRPHLTTYQAKFRKWYDEELRKDENINLTPQEIQVKYPKYEELIVDMKDVNNILKNYSEELKKLIKGK